MNDLLKNLRLTVRSLVRKPAFSVITILSLGLGIGATAAVFSIVNTLLLQPLLIEDAENVVRFRDVLRRSDGTDRRVNNSVRNFLAIRDQAKAFEAVGAHRYRPFDLVGSEEPEQVGGLAVSVDALPLMGIQPILGRLFSPEEDKPGAAANVALISHELWRRQFGASEDILGQEVSLSESPYTVIGVLPPRFQYPYGAQVWVPLGAVDTDEDRGHYLHMVARLAPGVDFKEAQTELDVIAKRLQQAYPDTNENWSFSFYPVREDITSHIQGKVLVTLLAASAFLLIIACANAANMLLALSLEQGGEIALRTALGAGRRHLVRQMLTQGLILGIASGLVGLLLAFFTIKPIVALSPIADIPMFENTVDIDFHVLGFTLLVSIAVGLIFSLVPALKISNPNLQEVLKEGARSSVSGRNRKVLQAFVIAEVAVAVILLIGAGLMVKNLQKLQQADLGFDPAHHLTLRLSLPDSRFPEDSQRQTYVTEMLARLEAAPGIEAANITTLYPLETSSWGVSFVIQGREAAAGEESLVANMRYVSPNFLRGMGIPVLLGRDISSQDTADSQQVVIVSQKLAERFWPDQNPIGKQLKQGRMESETPWLSVVGVAGDVKDYGDLDIALYFPQVQQGFADPFTTLVVTTLNAPGSQLEAVRKEIRAVDPNQPASYPATGPELFSELHGAQNLSTLLFVVFATLGLSLASIGIYGILSYLVQQRRHELGLRLALGAGSEDILRQVVGQGMRLATIGLVVGGLGAVFLSRFLRSQLEDLSTVDPTTFVVIALISLVIAAVASFIPAYRATTIDPVRTLRNE